MKRKLLSILSVGALTLAAVGLSEATPIFIGPSPYLAFDNTLPGAGSAISPFRGLSFSYFYLETFEDHLLNTPGVSASTGGITSVVFGPLFHDSVDADDGVIDGSGLIGDSFYSSSGAVGIKFTFNASILGELPTQAGIVWTDGAGTTLFEAFGSSGISLGAVGPVAIADGSVSGTTDEDRFFGIIDAGGISAIKISNTIAGIEVDHLQYGFNINPVPEPISMLLFGTGIVGIGGYVRKKFKRN